MAVIENEKILNKIIDAFESLPDWESKCFVRFWNGFTKQKWEQLFKNPINNQTIDNIKWMPDEEIRMTLIV